MLFIQNGLEKELKVPIFNNYIKGYDFEQKINHNKNFVDVNTFE